MTFAKWAMLGYGIAMIALGVFAFAEKHSLPSLLGGGFIGSLVIGMMFLSLKHPRPAYIVTFVAAVAMIGQFGAKILQPNPPWQAYAIPSLSIFLIAILVGGHLMARRSS